MFACVCVSVHYPHCRLSLCLHIIRTEKNTDSVYYIIRCVVSRCAVLCCENTTTKSENHYPFKSCWCEFWTNVRIQCSHEIHNIKLISIFLLQIIYRMVYGSVNTLLKKEDYKSMRKKWTVCLLIVWNACDIFVLSRIFIALDDRLSVQNCVYPCFWMKTQWSTIFAKIICISLQIYLLIFLRKGFNFLWTITMFSGKIIPNE